jgi:2-methylisocitrate lyase-like PEP mutase family enzyme
MADMEMLRTVLSSISSPFNLLISSDNAHLSVADVREAGVKRISVGGALARAAATGFLNAAREIAEHGSFRYAQGLLGGEGLQVFLKRS